DQTNAFAVASLSGYLYTTRTEYDAKRHAVILRVESIKPMPVEWGLRLGDVVHNYRSCLDHVAWAIVRRGRRPPSRLSDWEQSSVYFPISRTRNGFNDS